LGLHSADVPRLLPRPRKFMRAQKNWKLLCPQIARGAFHTAHHFAEAAVDTRSNSVSVSASPSTDAILESTSHLSGDRSWP